MKPPERDYSHRSLFEKLGVRADAHVATVGRHDATFTLELSMRLAKSPSVRLRATYDMIFLRVDRSSDLTAIPRAARRLEPHGALWIFHPKGRAAMPSDADVRAAALAAGLVDNKISAYTDTHTATRYVIPLINRTARGKPPP